MTRTSYVTYKNELGTNYIKHQWTIQAINSLSNKCHKGLSASNRFVSDSFSWKLERGRGHTTVKEIGTWISRQELASCKQLGLYFQAHWALSI